METSAAQRFLVEVRFKDIIDAPEFAELHREYSAECSIPELGPTDPQKDIYANMEKIGLMHSFAFYCDGALAGFATLLLFILPHYGKKVANVESLFLAKPYRTGDSGRSLMKNLEYFAAHEGCCAMLYNARAGSRLEKFLEALSGYQRTNSVFLRSLA